MLSVRLCSDCMLHLCRLGRKIPVVTEGRGNKMIMIMAIVATVGFVIFAITSVLYYWKFKNAKVT